MDDWIKDLTIGQITVGCAPDYLDVRFANENWRENQPLLAKWYAAFAERTSMQMTQPQIV